MANTKQATKRATQAEQHRKLNMSQRSTMRSALKKCLALLQAGQKEQLVASFKEACSLLDRFARRGLIHVNKAARLKSRLHTKVKAAA